MLVATPSGLTLGPEGGAHQSIYTPLIGIGRPGLLHRDWMAARRARWTGGGVRPSHAETLLSELAPTAGLVTVIDGSPGALSWIGGVRGMRVSALGLDGFGQVGDLPDLYRHYRLDAEAILDACADLFLEHGCLEQGAR